MSAASARPTAGTRFIVVRAAITGGTPALEKMAASLVRAATKAELAAGQALPRKIVRWRA